RSPLVISLHLSRHPPSLHPFPTRRSSDLTPPVRRAPCPARPATAPGPDAFSAAGWSLRRSVRAAGAAPRRGAPPGWPARQERRRSEEHTSELQSPYDLVCRLLLEKKKKMQ